MQKKKILIVGGGVAGTALAGFLKDTAEVTLIDKTPKWGSIGYAIVLWGNGRKILAKLGIENSAIKNSYEIPWDALENSKGIFLKGLNVKYFHKYGSVLLVTRTDLHKALITNLGNEVNVRLAVTVSEIQNTANGATVVFSDGSKDFYDLVVGADGIRSQIRSKVFGEGFLKYYGWRVWVFWVPKNISFPRGIIQFSTAGRMYSIYPMLETAAIMLAAVVPPSIPRAIENKKDLLHKLFSNFKISVSHIIDAIEDPEHLFVDDLAHIDMKVWHKDRVVLIGDAQHATSPMTGMGASMALEDAFVLSEELNSVAKVDISKALEKFTQRRSHRITKFRKISHLVEIFLMPKSKLFTTFRDFYIKFVPERFFFKAFEDLLKDEV